MNWYEEQLHPHIRQSLKISGIVHRERTDHQDLLIFENPSFGRVLVLDGVLQTTERDEFVYHEMLAHVPILAHGGVRRVLIIGGGDGGVLEEVLKHEVERVTMVEIDGDVVRICREHLSSICGKAFEDSRTNLIIGDGANFVAETDERFDVIIIDSTDPLGPGEVLFGEEFYRNCKRCLDADGIVITQNGVPFVQAEELRNSYRRLGKLFADVTFYVGAIPTYNGGHMAFGWASEAAQHRHVPLETLGERFEAARLDTRYYGPEVHLAAFMLPGYIHELIA